MKRLLILAAIATVPPLASLVACEGEPPVNAPENPLGVQPVVASVSATASTPEAPATASVTTGCLPPPCSPTPVPSTAAASASASAAPESGASATAVPPPAVVRGNIVGSVTTKPAALIGQAVVYLEDGPTEDAPPHLQTVTVDNRRMTFVPFVSVVSVGGKVVFANEDPFPHNVF